jgi:hypothetical protein
MVQDNGEPIPIPVKRSSIKSPDSVSSRASNRLESKQPVDDHKIKTSVSKAEAKRGLEKKSEKSCLSAVLFKLIKLAFNLAFIFICIWALHGALILFDAPTKLCPFFW